MSKRRQEAEGGKLGRPVSFDRNEAVQRAMKLFWEAGFVGVSSLRLAESMDIQRSSFYNSFGTRQRVFQEALECYAAWSPDRYLDQVGEGEPVLPVFVKVFRELCRLRAGDPVPRGCLVTNSIAELVGVDEELGQLLAQVVRRRLRRVEELLERAVSGGELPSHVDAPNLARLVVVTLMGLNTLSKVVRDEGELWGACREFLLGAGFPPDLLESGSSGIGKQAIE